MPDIDLTPGPDGVATRTIKGVQKTYNIGPTKTYELIAAGEFEVLKIGRRTLITDASIRRSLAARIRSSEAA